MVRSLLGIVVLAIHLLLVTTAYNNAAADQRVRRKDFERKRNEQLKQFQDALFDQWKHNKKLLMLSRAAHQGLPELAKKLIASGADVNEHNAIGRTPLHWAIQTRGDTQTIQLLLDHGAKPNLADKHGITPLHLASHTNDELKFVMLLNYGADINAVDINGRTPLFWFIEYASRGDLDAFLWHSPDLNAQDNSGMTPLHLAVYMGNTDRVGILLKHGSPINVQNIRGRTPMHEAAIQGQSDIVRLLVEYGADLQIKDNKGETPIQIILRTKSSAKMIIYNYRHEEYCKARVEYQAMKKETTEKAKPEEMLDQK